jgi:hypothetical protein
MPRIRTIKPDYWKSEKLARRLPGADGREARRLFVGLWNFAEDHGVCRGNPTYLRAELYPYDDDVTVEFVVRVLDLLERGGFIVRFERDGCSYIWIRGFRDHQRIDKPSKPSFPEPSEEERGRFVEGSWSPPGALVEPSPSPRGGLPVGREGKGKEGNGSLADEKPSAPPLQLVEQKAEKKPRKASLQEQFFTKAQAERADRLRALHLKPEELPDVWAVPKINAQLSFVTRESWARGSSHRESRHRRPARRWRAAAH